MKNYTQILDDWSKEVDENLPVNCPKCGKVLDQIRYACDKTITTIRLTGVVDKFEYLVAECPYCKYKLLKEEISKYIR